jgi:hypothetical protein
MNSVIMLSLCIVAWTFTFVKLVAILLGDIRKIGMITLNIWAMLLFFSVTLTFMITDFAAFFNTHTFPNLSLLITHFAFLASQYCAVVTILAGIGTPATTHTIFWTRLFLFVELTLLSVIYIFFLSKTPETVSEFQPIFFVVIFKFLSYPFGIMLCIITVRTILTHLPSHQFTLIRLRAVTIILCTSSAGMYIFIRALIYAGFFWPILSSPLLFTISYVILFCSAILFFASLLSNKIYARFVILSRSVESWQVFQDLKCLRDHLLLFCPVIGMPPESPTFWRFFFNPEYHLYRTMISILDSKVMLADFLVESVKSGMPVWDGSLLDEAIRLNTALQSANPPNDFSDIVETYRRVSRDLFVGQI